MFASCLTAAPRYDLVAPSLEKFEIPHPRLTKVHRAKAMVFPVVMYRCESWTIEKAESQRIVAFKL